jgi:uncharacterized membrane protein YfcA
MHDITSFEWLWLVIGAAGIGISKSGFSGLTMLHILVYAMIFGAKESTGILLPLLIVGDISSIFFYGHRVEWVHVRRLLPPALAGVVVGWWSMGQMDELLFRRLVGTIIIVLTVVQLVRLYRPKMMESMPHSRWFGLMLGFVAGVSTMMANSAGPIVAIYLLAVAMPKLELVGTSAWFFLVINVYKLPFSFSLGLIHGETLWVNLLLAPAVPLGMWLGHWMLHRISQQWFDGLLLAFIAIAALRLLEVF